MKVKLNNVGKRYRLDWVLKGLSVSFNSGTQYAVTGPNGSGKSTLLRILSGHLSPSKGRVSFFRKDKKMDISQVYQHLSIAAPYIDLIEEFTLREAIRFHQKFKPLQNDLTTAELVKILALPKAADKQIRNFSSGMKQRLKLALAICSNSELLLLDEPSSNLDIQGIDWYRSLMETYAGDRLVIIASNVEVDLDFCRERLNILDYKN